MSEITREEALAHFGVKGMHWGVRKASTPNSRELARAIKKRDAIDGNKAFDGYGLRGWGAKKIYKKEVKKHPHYALNKLNKEETLQYNKKASRRVSRSIALRGAGEVATILAVGGFAINKIGSSPQAKIGASISLVLLAGQIGSMSVNELNNVRLANKLDKRRSRVQELEDRIRLERKAIE